MASETDGVVRLATVLAEAWNKYVWLFAEVPHGTVKQLAAMIELSPQAKEYIRLYEKQRDELETI